MARPRFSLQWKIALLTAALLVLAVAAFAVVTVYQPWLARLAAQRHLALERVRPLSPTIVRLSAEGVSFRSDVMRDLVTNSAATPGQELLFALLYDESGKLIEPVSVVNEPLLGRLAPKLLALYRTEPKRALTLLAARRVGVQPVSVTLKEGDAKVGRMLLGLSTTTIDAEARAVLVRELEVLAGLLLFELICAALMARRLARPLTALAAAMGRTRQGEFQAELEVESHTRDEIGDLARAFNSMLQGLRERERLRGTLDRYVSGDVAERILSEVDDLSLRGEIRQVTALFLDVRGFTSLSELLTPQEMVALLNDYFQVMVEAVQRSGGTVNKFIGDAALCLWGAPRAAKNPELSAVRAALEIQTRARALSESRTARGLQTVDFGIGINCGEALAGNLGAAQRLEYTVIGDAINTAQRLESHAKAGEVLVSQSIYERVAGHIEATPREPVKLKGKQNAVPLWEVRRLKLGAALLAIACLLGPLGCERDQSGEADELTITVRGDRRELELQEKELQQRESELRAQKESLDARIGELVKSVGQADAEQRRRLDDEIKKARERQSEVAASVQSVIAQKTEVETKKSAIDAPPPAESGALASREAALASREGRLAERDAELARREKELAAREAAQAESERAFAAKALAADPRAASAPALSPPRDVPQASNVEARHKKLLDDLAARGLLIADLPVEDQPLNADIWAARRQGDFARASDLLIELSRAVKQLQVDQRLVEQKMRRLQSQRASARLSDAQRKEVESLLREVTASYSDGRYDEANRGLNRIAAVLDASASPG